MMAERPIRCMASATSD